MASIHIGDTGTELVIFIPDEDGVAVPLAGASELTAILVTPANVTKERIATLFTDGTDGKIKYVTAADDIDVSGTWEIRGRVTLTTNRWTSDPDTFTVMD